MKPIDHKAKAKRAALNALRRTRRTAEQTGVELSEWEGEFLGSVEERVETYGRAFADPDLGAMNGALSLRQGLKLKEIAAKAKGKSRTARPTRKPAKPTPARGIKAKPKPGFKRRSGLTRRAKAHGQ